MRLPNAVLVEVDRLRPPSGIPDEGQESYEEAINVLVKTINQSFRNNEIIAVNWVPLVVIS